MKEQFLLLGVAILISLLVFLSYNFGLFSGLENFFEDLLFVSRPIHPDLVILAIDNESIQRLGQWPWPRQIFAQAIRRLDQARPKALGVDVIFAEASRQGSSDDVMLAQALETLSFPVVLPAEIFSDKTLVSLDIFRDHTRLGHVNLILDQDGIVRKFPIELIAEDGQRLPAFSLALLKDGGISLFEEEGAGRIRTIVYAAPPGAVPRIPFYRLVQDETTIEQFRGKIVLIGVTASDLHDEQLTPFSRGRAMPGVEIQANIVNMFLQGYRLQALSKTATGIWIFILGLIIALVFVRFKRSIRPIFVNLAVGVAVNILGLILVDEGTVPNFLHLNAAWVFSAFGLFGVRYFVGERERREMKNIFSRYVSTDVLEEILRDPGRVALGGEEVEVTILFSDIRGFTSLAEHLSSQEVVRLLNGYFEAMSGEILKEHGVLDKYIGDAIMAFWGAPIADELQADHAVKAALGMIERLKNFNLELEKSGQPAIKIGIGIHTGKAVVGNIGSEKRFDYTAIGDTVNIASRLQDLTKEYPASIIIGQNTKERLGNTYSIRPLGSTTVKGKQQPVEIYGVDAISA